jgi:SNF2 family DNA or RNA helicase
MAFERAYAVRQRMRSRDGSQRWIEVVGFQHLDDLERRVARLSFRALAKDCLDLPPVVVSRLDVELSAAQGRTIRALKSDMMAELDSGQYVDGRNILVRYGKMAEIAGGWVHTLNPDGTKAEEVEAFSPNPRLDTLLDYLGVELRADPTRKVVVFAQHTAEVTGVVEGAAQWGAVRFDGTIHERDREANRLQFNTDPDCRVFVAQYRCGSMGLNLTVADTLIFYSLTFAYGLFAQAQKRVHRKGQVAGEVREVYLMARVPSANGRRFSRSLDHVMIEALRAKKDLADIVTGDRAREILEAMGE